MTVNLKRAWDGLPKISARVLVAFVCLLLVLLVGSAHLLHTHSAGDEAANPSCSLCAVAHLTALPAPVLGTPVAAESILLLRRVSAFVAPLRYFAPSLCVRPPPASTSNA